LQGEFLLARELFCSYSNDKENQKTTAHRKEAGRMDTIKTTYDNLDQMFSLMETLSDSPIRFFPNEEECQEMEQHLDKYFQFIIFLLANQIPPSSQEEKDSVKRLNDIVKNHVSYKEETKPSKRKS
jgi:hypothetical protein